jgi:hypothetical protein
VRVNSFAVLQALAFEPKKAFAELAARPRILFPLLLLILSTVGILFWYFSVVDVAWFIAQAQAANPGGQEMTAEQQRAVESMGGSIVKWSTVIGGAIVLLLIRCGEALYYLLAGKVTNVQRSYKQWLSLSSWSSLPGVLGMIPAAIVLLTTTTTQFDQGQLQALSFNNLFFHRTMSEPGYSFLSSINLLQIAGMYLATLGVRIWSGRSWLFSTVFTCLPIVLIYGVWGYFALGRA